MSRVRIASQPWGVVQDTAGNVRSALTVTITDLASGAATVYAAATGGTTTSPTTNSHGEVAGWIEEDTYLLDTGSGAVRVEAVAGATVKGKVDKSQAIVNVIDYGWLPGVADTGGAAAALAALPTTSSKKRGALFFPKANNLAYNVSADVLNLDDSQSVSFIGEGGRTGGQTPSSTINISSNGTFGLSLRSAMGFSANDIAFTYDSAFTGTLVRSGHGVSALDPQFVTFTRCMFGGGGSVRTAALLVDLDLAVNWLFLECNFAGAQRAVRGRAGSTLSTQYSNAVRFIGGATNNCVFTPHLNPGDQWTYISHTFSPLVGSGAVTDSVTGAVTVANQAGAIISATGVISRGLTMIGCGFFDSTSGITGSKWVDLSRATSQGPTILGGLIGNAETAFDLGAAVNGFVAGQSWPSTYTTKVTATGTNTTVLGTGDTTEAVNLAGDINLRGGANFIKARALSNVNNAVLATGAGTAFDAMQISGAGALSLGPGSGAADVLVQRFGAGQWGVSTAHLLVATVGKGLRVAEGSNAKQGVSGAMVAGTVTVANTSITASSRLLLTRQAGGTNPGAVYESTRTAGTSFVITSTNAADTGTVAYQIFEAA